MKIKTLLFFSCVYTRFFSFWTKCLVIGQNLGWDFGEWGGPISITELGSEMLFVPSKYSPVSQFWARQHTPSSPPPRCSFRRHCTGHASCCHCFAAAQPEIQLGMWTHFHVQVSHSGFMQRQNPGCCGSTTWILQAWAEWEPHPSFWLWSSLMLGRGNELIAFRNYNFIIFNNFVILFCNTRAAEQNFLECPADACAAVVISVTRDRHSTPGISWDSHYRGVCRCCPLTGLTRHQFNPNVF